MGCHQKKNQKSLTNYYVAENTMIIFNYLSSFVPKNMEKKIFGKTKDMLTKHYMYMATFMMQGTETSIMGGFLGA